MLRIHQIASAGAAKKYCSRGGDYYGQKLVGEWGGKGADLLVMGAYGRGQVMSFLGFGGATGKVISSCRVPLLLAH